MTNDKTNDLTRIEKIIEDVFGASALPEQLTARRLGGLTNRSYEVLLADGTQYVVRLPGEGTESMINRAHEQVSTELACRLGVYSELRYFGPDGTKISQYIPAAETMTAERMRESGVIQQIAEILRTMHHSGVDTGVPFDVFSLATQYEAIIYEHDVALFADYGETKAQVSQIKQWVDQNIKPERQPCHNDPLCENWVLGGNRLYLVDWEYAGMNDGMWDLAAVSIEAGYDERCDRELLAAYLGEDQPLEAMHLLAAKIFVDYLWTLWAKARVPYGGQAMEDWAQERYARLLAFLEAFVRATPRYGIVL